MATVAPRGGSPQLCSGPMSDAERAAARLAFTQALMERGYMPDADARSLFLSLYGASRASSYVEFVSEVNHRVSKAGYGVVRARTPPLRQAYVGFVNRSASELTKGATDYQDEAGRPDLPLQAFLSACVLALGGEEARWVGGTHGWPRLPSSTLLALPLEAPSPDEGDVPRRRLELSPHARQTALDRFGRDGWLADDPEAAGYVTLGPRAYLELSGRLLEAGCPDPLAEVLRTFAAA